MNQKNIKNIFYRLNVLTVFRKFLDEPVCDAFRNIMMIDANEGEDWDRTWKTEAYGSLARGIIEEGGDLGLLIKDYIIKKDDYFIDEILKRDDLDSRIVKSSDPFAIALKYDLDTLQLFSKVTSRDIKDILFADDSGFDEGFTETLPEWINSKVNLKREYERILKNLSTEGYGIYHDNIMFKVDEGKLVPVENPDYQSLEELYCYDRERNLVLKNTEELAYGRPASNVLLYGDAGTGKSSTVKACAAHFSSKGVRLIEFNKNQVSYIPEIAKKLYLSPLKFIFFIDDLTFTENDEDYYALKGILEGSVRGNTPNILIYATSNRRHLVRESMAERQGDDVHLNDTLQETMSLSARFGLTITFSKPEKDIYLSIVKSMALDKGIIDPKDRNYQDKLDELLAKAEIFAIRASGRSPRAAKQFILQNNLR